MKLIKIDGYWIIVSDEERVKGDIVLGNFPDNPIGIITDIYEFVKGYKFYYSKNLVNI